MSEPGHPRILVVEDEPDMCWALENILRPAHYHVTAITRGLDALERLVTEEFEAVFLDAKLPDIDGLDLAAQIRQRWPSISIVLISGYFYPEDPDIVQGLESELFIGFVPKPFDLSNVRRIAEYAIERTRRKYEQGVGPAPGTE